MLDMESSKELYIFLFSINQGIILGIAYDIYRVIRGNLKQKKLLGILGDIILWIIITVLVFIFLLKHLNGIFRGFVFIGFFIGGLFYIKILSHFIYPILFKSFKLILDLINEIILIILYPFKKTKKLFTKGMSRYKKMLSMIIKETKKYIGIINKKK